MGKKKFKITRHNFIKVILVAYAVIIGSILIMKWIAFTNLNKELLQRVGQSVLISVSKVDYKKHIETIRSSVSQETIAFFETAKERLVGKDVKRMSDLGASVEASLNAFFDGDARRLDAVTQIKDSASDEAAEALKRTGEGEENEGEQKNEEEKNKGDEPNEGGKKQNLKPVDVNLNPNLRMLLRGLGDLIAACNAEQVYDTDLAYDADPEQAEFVTPETTRAELATVIFPDQAKWKITFDASAASNNFLGGIEIVGDRNFSYVVALVLVKDVILFVDRREGNSRILSGNEVLLQFKALLDAELPDARARDRLARAGQPVAPPVSSTP